MITKERNSILDIKKILDNEFITSSRKIELIKEIIPVCNHDIKPSKIRGYGQCHKCGLMFPEVKQQ